jgi:hypothetical protein
MGYDINVATPILMTTKSNLEKALDILQTEENIIFIEPTKPKNQ